MIKGIFIVAIATAIVSLSTVPSWAVTCAGTCSPSSMNLGTDPLAATFADAGIGSGTSISDGWTFTLDKSATGSVDEITLATTGYISDLVLAVYSGTPTTGTLVASAASSCPSCSPPQFLLIQPLDLTSGDYYVQISGTATTDLSYSGNLGFVPLPGAQTLFGCGLGVLAVVGLLRRGKRRCGSISELVAAG